MPLYILGCDAKMVEQCKKMVCSLTGNGQCWFFGTWMTFGWGYILYGWTVFVFVSIWCCRLSLLYKHSKKCLQSPRILFTHAVCVCVCADKPHDTAFAVYVGISSVAGLPILSFLPVALFCNLVSCFTFRWRVVCQSTEENRAQTSWRLNVAILSRGCDATKAGIQQIAETAWRFVFSFKKTDNQMQWSWLLLAFVSQARHHISWRSNPFLNDSIGAFEASSANGRTPPVWRKKKLLRSGWFGSARGSETAMYKMGPY